MSTDLHSDLCDLHPAPLLKKCFSHASTEMFLIELLTVEGPGVIPVKLPDAETDLRDFFWSLKEQSEKLLITFYSVLGLEVLFCPRPLLVLQTSLYQLEHLECSSTC